MDIKLLMKNIEDYFEDNNYMMTLKEINSYLNLESVGIDAKFLNIYIESQIRLGYFNKACKNIDIMRKLFPEYYSNYELAVKYSRCSRIDKLNEILSNCKLTYDSYYNIAIHCYFNREYDKAKELFNYFILGSKNIDKIDKAKNYLRKIKLYETRKEIFPETKYSYFKYKGFKLNPGHIIHVDRLRDDYKENQFNTDPKSSRRPYMIWRIIDGKIYAFPLSTKIKGSRCGILFKKKYPSADFDRVVRNEMVCIEECDVRDVLDKVKTDDYQNIIDNIYRSVCMNHDVPKKVTQFFMNTMSRELGIEVYDVIIIPDFLQGKKRYYLVIDFNNKKHKYKVIEVRIDKMGNFEVIGNNAISVSEKVSILSVIKLDVDKKNKLVGQVPSNFKNVNMLGKIVEYNSRKLEIMIEENDCYLCVDRTLNCSSSYISIEFIRKDIPLNIVGAVSNDEYQRQLLTLRHYMTQNSNDVYSKKKIFYSYNKRANK